MGPVRRGLAIIALWQVLCLGLRWLLLPPVVSAYARLYQALFGDVQRSFGAFTRSSVLLLVAVIPLPATWLCLRLHAALAGRRHRRGDTARARVIWQAALLGLFSLTYELGLGGKINQLDWAVFGEPTDLNGLGNLVLPHLLAWLVCSTPAAVLALWAFERLGRVQSTPDVASRASRGRVKSGRTRVDDQH